MHRTHFTHYQRKITQKRRSQRWKERNTEDQSIHVILGRQGQTQLIDRGHEKGRSGTRGGYRFFEKGSIRCSQ